MRGVAGGAVNFGHRWLLVELGHEGFVVRSIDRGGDKSGNRSSQGRWRDNRSVAGDDAPLFQPTHPLDHRWTREPHLLGQRFHGQAAVTLQRRQDLLVEGINLIRHRTHPPRQTIQTYGNLACPDTFLPTSARIAIADSQAEVSAAVYA